MQLPGCALGVVNGGLDTDRLKGSINATRDDQAAHMHAEPATTLHHGDSLEALLGYRGQYILCWTDSDGEEQQKTTTANAD